MESSLIKNYFPNLHKPTKTIKKIKVNKLKIHHPIIQQTVKNKTCQKKLPETNKAKIFMINNNRLHQ